MGDVWERLPPRFYRRPAEVVAPDLLGRYLVRSLEGSRDVVRIVETEAYLGAADRASHAWGDRRTRRTASLFRDGGSAYVYLIYGIHCMLNVVTGSRQDGSAVLIRAAEPVEGVGRMATRRRLAADGRAGAIAGGPGKLCQALAVGLDLDGAPLDRGELRLAAGRPVPADEIAVGPRVGVDYAGEAAGWPLRFAEIGNQHVSKPAPPRSETARSSGQSK